MKQFLLVLILIIAMVFLWKWFGKRELRTWNANYPYLNSANWEQYEAIQIMQHDLTYQSGGWFADSAKKSEQGYLFYDTTDYSFWGEIVTDTYHWINISSEGRIISQDSLSTDMLNRMNLILPLVYNEQWQGTLFPLKMNHFIKEQYNWSRLNPFVNIGNTTGGGSGFSWEGTSYHSLQMADEAITFRTKNRLGDSYHARISFCYLPHAEKQSALIYIEDQHWEKPDRGLYLIRKKQR